MVIVIYYVVFVGATQSIESTVCFGNDGTYFVDSYVGRQNTIEFVGRFGRIVEGYWSVEVGNHESGVDAGVGSSRSCHRSFTAEQCG